MIESEARLALVRYAAIVWQRGLVAGASGNLSVRLDDGTLLVTPTRRSLRALEPAELARVSEDGAPLGDTKPTSELPLHLAAYRVRADVRAIVHTHSTNAVAWSKRGDLFALDTVGAIESLGPIAIVPYAPAGSEALARSCAAEFERGAQSIVMARHGLTAVGATLEAAFARADLAEQTAHIEVLAHLLRDR